MNTFGAKLKNCRKDMSLSQKELGQKIGVAESTISLYESNKRFPDAEIEWLDGSAAMGNIEDKEDRELLRASLETAMKIAKRTAKKKFTPKKYQK